MHDNVLLGGPVWAFAQLLILLAVLLSLFVFFDSLRPKRKARLAGLRREPLWVYTALSGVFLLALIVVQLIPGLQLASAGVSLATPVALVVGFAYLLRVVFPKPHPTDDAWGSDHSDTDSAE